MKKRCGNVKMKRKRRRRRISEYIAREGKRGMSEENNRKKKKIRKE